MADEPWWKRAIVYQIYPKSFQDTNQDGVGDIQGIIERLDYIKWLGANVIWLCPVYCSPMDDNGYDISDYYHIDPSFGTDEDVDALIEEARKRGMKVLMDLVVNHTSDEHKWFQQGLREPNGEYANYYIFKEGVNGKEPNNWRSYFGNSVWEQVGDSNRYYFHSFGKKQPDLNWENPKLRQEIYDMMNYWLDKGLGGFRVDAIGNLKKNYQEGIFPADGVDGMCHAGKWILNQPGIEDFLTEMKKKTFTPHNSMTVAEVDVPDERLKEFIGEDGFFSMVFDFSYTDIDVPDTGEWFIPTNWTVQAFKENLFRSQKVAQESGWAAVYLENHDQPRSLNKYLPEEDINGYSTTMLATVFMMLRGTPFIYQGQEIGMTNIRMDSMEDYDDIASHDQYARAKRAGKTKEEAFEAVYKRSRDNSRTPMQWNDEKYAGFTKAESVWMKVNPNYKTLNVKREMGDLNSILNYYKKLISLRIGGKCQKQVVYGAFLPYDAQCEAIIAYERMCEGQGILVVNNFSNREQELKIPSHYKKVQLCNYETLTKIKENGMYRCRPYESVILCEEEI